MLAANLPSDLERAIAEVCDRLSGGYVDPVDVAIRSSARAEDLPDASFAGQQETYLNVQGHQARLDACRRCFASLFADRAISYRVDKGFDHFKIGLSIGVQRMVRSDLSASSIMFSIDTETGFRDAHADQWLLRLGRKRGAPPGLALLAWIVMSRGTGLGLRVGGVGCGYRYHVLHVYLFFELSRVGG